MLVVQSSVMSVPSQIAVAVLATGDSVLVRPRPPQDPILAGRLEFPGGKITDKESPVAAAKRETYEETGLHAPPLVPLTSFSYRYPDRTVTLYFFFGRWLTPPSVSSPWRWEPLAALRPDRIPAANQAVISLLLKPSPPETPDGL